VQATEDASIVSATVTLKWQAIVEKDRKQQPILIDARNEQEENWKRWYVLCVLVPVTMLMTEDTKDYFQRAYVDGMIMTILHQSAANATLTL
jgi:hypothetical protein